MGAPITVNRQCLDSVLKQAKTVDSMTIPQPMAIVGPEGSGIVIESTVLACFST